MPEPAAATGKPITIFEITHDRDAHFIVEEIVEGQTLRELLRDPESNQPQPLELEHALDIAIQIARALKAADAKLVLMAGRPGEREGALRAAGVDQFLYAGQDAIEVLRGLQEKLG